mgnify:CR=1 FL=1
MSTRHDKNYRSFTGQYENLENVTLDPLGAGWVEGSWQDTCKFWKCDGCFYEGFYIHDAGTEDAVDVGTDCINNVFMGFTVNGGKQVLTLKSESNDNMLVDWIIERPGSVVDIEIGSWGSQNTGPSKGNFFHNWKRRDFKPITYAYRWGCRPKFVDMDVKHLWWRSVGITLFVMGKYFWHKVLKRPDK